jgi:alcohol dehydrogenase
MRALVLDPPGGLSLRDVASPTHPGECLIRVSAAGICGTDLHMLAGYAAFSGIIGHEFVGIVEATPPADAHWLGKRVVGEINVGCGGCRWCERGINEHCVKRTVLGIRGRAGAFAEFLTLPAANLHEVPPSIGEAAAVFVEPVAAACRILEQVSITLDTTIAVLGDGRFGLLVAQVLRTRSAHVTLLGRHTHKMTVAGKLGIVARVENKEDARYDVVVDATGRQEGLTRAIELVEPRGTIVLKSTFHGEAGTPLWPVAVHEVTIVGSRCGPFAPAIELLASGVVQTQPLVSASMPLEKHEDAFAAARAGLKVIFDLV